MEAVYKASDFRNKTADWPLTKASVKATTYLPSLRVSNRQAVLHSLGEFEVLSGDIPACETCIFVSMFDNVNNSACRITYDRLRIARDGARRCGIGGRWYVKSTWWYRNKKRVLGILEGAVFAVMVTTVILLLFAIVMRLTHEPAPVEVQPTVSVGEYNVV